MHLGMKHAKAEMIFKSIEVVIPVKQSESGSQAKACDETVDCLSYGQTSAPQHSIILSRGDRQIRAAGREHLKIEKIVAYLEECRMLANSL